MGDPEWFDAKAAGWWVWGAAHWIGSGWCSGKGPWTSRDGKLARKEDGNEVGVMRQMPRLEDGWVSCYGDDELAELFSALSERLRRVKVCCGEWDRIFSPSIFLRRGQITGVFLDPPYALDKRSETYAMESDVGSEVRAWCLEHGNDKRIRIVLAGYDGEHNDLEERGWRVHAWKATGGYGNQAHGRGRENAVRERLWFSPHCHQPKQGVLL